MPQFGDKLSNIDNNKDLFVRLTNVKDQVQFRLVKNKDAYVYEAKHFTQDGDKWIIELCPRVMLDKNCAYCDKYFEIIAQKKDEKDENIKKQIEEEARPYRVSTTFYFPIVDRKTNTARILQTTGGIRKEIEAEFEAGIDVFNYDYILARMAKSGANTYKLTRLDSTQAVDLDTKEQGEYTKAENWDMYDLTGIGKGLRDLEQLHKNDEEADRPTRKNAKARKESTEVADGSESFPWES